MIRRFIWLTESKLVSRKFLKTVCCMIVRIIREKRDFMFELIDNIPQSAVIKVLGVGGGGGNAVHHMITNEVDGVDFICQHGLTGLEQSEG